MQLSIPTLEVGMIFFKKIWHCHFDSTNTYIYTHQYKQREFFTNQNIKILITSLLSMALVVFDAIDIFFGWCTNTTKERFGKVASLFLLHNSYNIRKRACIFLFCSKTLLCWCTNEIQINEIRHDGCHGKEGCNLYSIFCAKRAASGCSKIWSESF